MRLLQTITLAVPGSSPLPNPLPSRTLCPPGHLEFGISHQRGRTNSRLSSEKAVADDMEMFLLAATCTMQCNAIDVLKVRLLTLLVRAG
jgi:hypothetical protein